MVRDGAFAPPHHEDLAVDGGRIWINDQFLTAALQNPANEIIAEELFRLALPDAWLVSGCLVQTAWNVLTSRAVDYGINDYDVFYFDPDTSWEAEDKVIRTLTERLASRGIQVEARNQARVHLWYPEKHGLPYPELRCSTEGIDRFLTQEYADRNPAHAGRLRGVRAEWLRRCRRTDRAAQSGREFFGGELRGEGGAMEGAVAGDHGAAGGMKFRSPDGAQRNPGSVAAWHSPSDCAALHPGYAATATRYRTTPEVNPAFRRGGLMSFFRKQCASLPA